MHSPYCVQLSLVQRVKGGEEEEGATEHDSNEKKWKVTKQISVLAQIKLVMFIAYCFFYQ